MDFGAMSFDNFLCSNTSNNGGFALENGTSAENNKQQKWYAGSGFLKQERAINQDDNNNLREFKVAKTTGNSCGEAMLKIPLQRSNCSNNLSVDGQQMLSFSSNPTLPYYHQTNSTAFSRNSGYINGGGMQGVLSGVRGPFTPSQWMELEHQALIYKYITANVPIPSYLLNPIRKAFESAGFPTFSGLRSNPLGWGGFHLGLSNSDPEPGRCRRTDGKKWRCSRDAVADQKYCERHMNRGRHRSRKPVEGQTQSQSNAASAGIAANPNNNAKLSSSTPSTSVAGGGGGVSNGLTLSHHHQLTNAQPPASAALPNINRSVLEKQNPNAAYLKHQNAYEELSSSSFGLVCSDSLLNPLNKSSSLVNKSHSLRQFMDNWPKNQSESAAWPDANQSDRTQLSISIPIASSPPPNETSPLRLPREQLEMGLGVGMTMTTVSDDHQTPRHSANWVPISWEPSMGGPLGEVLHTGDCKNTAKPLNLIDSWDNSPRLASSPTGVLQRGAFTSLSNSSAGSSPRAESNALMIGPGSGLMNPSLPAL